MSHSFINPLSIPVLGFCAYSGTGKTTLLKQLIPELINQGLRLAVIKHAHHDFDVDIPGKDSYEMRKAGAKQVLVASHIRWALMTEDAVDGDPKLTHLLQQIDTSAVDIVLVEGFKKLALPKIELHRAAHGKPFIHTQDDNIIAIACCDNTVVPESLPRLNLNNIQQISAFVLAYHKSWKTSQLGYVDTLESSTCSPEKSSLSLPLPLPLPNSFEPILDNIKPIRDIEKIAVVNGFSRILASSPDLASTNADIKSGLNIGSRLNLNTLKLLLEQGIRNIDVIKRPNVAILADDDIDTANINHELVALNMATLSTMLTKLDCHIVDLGSAMRSGTIKNEAQLLANKVDIFILLGTNQPPQITNDDNSQCITVQLSNDSATIQTELTRYILPIINKLANWTV